MKKAADARWAKKREADLAVPPPKDTTKPRKKRAVARRGSKGGRVYSVALATAEKQLAKAIEEMAKAAKLYAANAALIEPFTNTIRALRAQENPTPHSNGAPFQSNSGPVTYSLAQVMSDSPLPVVRPPMPPVEAIVAPLPRISPRAGGGTLDSVFQQEPDENAFLNDPSNPVTGGANWS